MKYAVKAESPTVMTLCITASHEEVNSAFERFPGDARGGLAVELAAAVLEKEHINPVSAPRYAGEEMIFGREYPFSAQFDVLPPIALPDVKSLTVRVPVAELCREDVQSLLVPLLSRYAVLREVKESRLPCTGDVALVSVAGTWEGRPVPGLVEDNLALRIREISRERTHGGSGQASVICRKELEKAVRALHPGEERSGHVLCPETHPYPQFRGRSVRFKVRLKKLFEEKLPAFDEAFAKRLGFGTLESLNKKLRADAMSQKINAIRQHAQADLLNSLIEPMDFPIPEHILCMFTQEAFLEARRDLQRQYFSEEQIADYLNDLKPEAERCATSLGKAHCFLLAVAHKEGLADEKCECPADYLKLNREDAEMKERMMTVRAMNYLYGKAKKIVVDRQGNRIQP